MVAVLGDLDIDALWQKTNDAERRVLIEELLKNVTVFLDHLEAMAIGTSGFNFLYAEIGLKGLENVRAGGPTSSTCYQPLAAS